MMMAVMRTAVVSVLRVIVVRHFSSDALTSASIWGPYYGTVSSAEAQPSFPRSLRKRISSASVLSIWSCIWLTSSFSRMPP